MGQLSKFSDVITNIRPKLFSAVSYCQWIYETSKHITLICYQKKLFQKRYFYWLSLIFKVLPMCVHFIQDHFFRSRPCHSWAVWLRNFFVIFTHLDTGFCVIVFLCLFSLFTLYSDIKVGKQNVSSMLTYLSLYELF